MMNNQEYELFSRGALNFGSGIANNEEDMRKNMNLFI
jgi:hypothetical protein